ncbi:unnamed protein product [Phyllotreta striolata]|uniref:Lipase domain-containing protein n=1 Tax=Phyllotreta striolata TaxID=444603 RepID=A0A9N9XPV7_PHYSR|nr:unnamed protein product [Phyllotreta striolata]
MYARFIIFVILASLANSQLRQSSINTYFYSKLNPVLGYNVNITDQSILKRVNYSNKKDTVFIIHGYLEMPTTSISSSQEIKNSILSKYDANLIVVDYGNPAAIFYPAAVQQVTPIAGRLSRMIKSMIDNSGLALNTTKIIGVSLGAHIAGITGYNLNGEVEEIIALDPAGPLFAAGESTNRLSKSSAKFVHVIHTNGGGLGNLEPLGHADYYVNGGRTQPACGPIPIGLCPHGLSVTYYSESIRRGRFKAKKCSDYRKFKSGGCENEEESWMGGYDLDKKANGTYYLDTNASPPYAKN